MRIATKLMSGFVAIAVMIGVTSYFGVSLSDQIWSLRRVELPMEQHLGQLEESLWEMIHAVDRFVADADPHHFEQYNEEVDDVESLSAQYLALTDTEEERAAVAEFDQLWSSVKGSAEKVVALVKRCKHTEDSLFEYVDKADDVIDFQIQAHLSPSDPNILAKEQSVREVEVSLWEAIYAVQQYAGLAPDISRADHAQQTFAELMEKQFDDVEEYWGKYTVLARSEDERKAIAAFESLWPQAVAAGREVVKLHDQAHQ